MNEAKTSTKQAGQPTGRLGQHRKLMKVGNQERDCSQELLNRPTECKRRPQSSIGSGLKRPLEVDESGRSILAKRQDVEGRLEPRSPYIHPKPESKTHSDEWSGL